MTHKKVNGDSFKIVVQYKVFPQFHDLCPKSDSSVFKENIIFCKGI